MISMTKIHTIDCHFLGSEEAVAAYLVTNGKEACFIDNNNANASQYLMHALEESGFEPHQVRYIIITHIHLDHAAGSARMLELCPNATFLAHPKAARHAINPELLIKSTKKVYGEETYEKMYGGFLPVPKDRVAVMEHNAKVRLGDTELLFLHTRGHADHHFCVFESETKSIFTGDSFGVSYTKFQTPKGRLHFPASTPTDFHYAEALLSLDRILDSGAETAYLTHYGALKDLQRQSNILRNGLKHYEELRLKLPSLSEPERIPFARQAMVDFFLAELNKIDYPESDIDWNYLDLDVDLNSQGLVYTKYQNEK